MIELRHRSDLTTDVVERIAFGGERLRLDAALLSEVDASRRQLAGALASGQRVYGVNTGMGYLAGTQLTDAEQRAHQRNLLLGRAVGGPPYLDKEEVRAMMAVRLSGFLSGNTGVSPQLCGFVADRLADGFTPAVPARAIGCAGEIIPLSHAFQTFLGIGSVIDGQGRLRDAASALADRGVTPYVPAAKEGIAMLAGAPGAVALAVVHRRRALILAGQLLCAAACAIDAIRAPRSPYSERMATLAADQTLTGVLARLRALLAGLSTPWGGKQAPVSFRVVPQVLANLERVLLRLGEDCATALAGVDDSPAFLDDEFVTSGGFHAVGLSTGMDMLAIALTQAAELGVQHTHRMLDARFTGLPDQLTPLPGPRTGLVLVHKRAVGALNELRRLAAPVSIGIADTSLGQEDAMSFEFEGAQRLRRVAEIVREIIACELLVARQAWSLRPEVPQAPGLEGIAASLCAAIEPVREDRPLGSDIAALVGLLERGELAG
ncbi:MAG: aromatic amino acid lyase [Sciscionella sp.]